jgi:small-conductance mechanosensitive channel
MPTPRWLSSELLDNPALVWLLAAATVALVLLVVVLLRRVALGRLERLAARTATQLDDLVVLLLRRTPVRLALFPALYLGSLLLLLPPPVGRGLEIAAILALLLQAGIWAMALVDFWAARYRRERLASDPAAVTTLGAVALLAKVAFWVVVVLLALDNLGFDVTALVAGLGVGGIAVALATQNILGDLFSSLSIVVDKPFVVGDAIAVGDLTGRVEHVGLKTTRLRSVSGEQIVFSNSDLLGSRIRNLERLEERRVVLVLGLRYDTPAERVAAVPELVREAVARQPRLRFERAHLRGFGAFALEVEAVYWVLAADLAVAMDLQQEVNLELLRRLAAANVGLAFPTQTLHVETLAPAPPAPSSS